jgi:DNA-binding CsgD family transcriptional regulator
MTSKKTPETDIESDNYSAEQFRKRAVELGIMNLDLDPDPDILDRLVKVLDQLPDDVSAALNRALVAAEGVMERNPQDFIDRHNISKAEGRLLLALAEGRSVAQHAGALGISVNTARTHMRRLLEKTGASGQLDLLRLFLGR